MSLGNRALFENKLISRLSGLFVDRESILEEFRKRLEGQENYLVLNLYGIGGSGKTSLLRKFESHLKEKNEKGEKIAYSYYNFELGTDVISSLLNLTEQLEKYGLNFPLFYLALLDFYLRRGRKEEAESLRQNRMQPLRSLGMVLTDLAGLIGGTYLSLGVKWLSRTVLLRMTEAQRRRIDYVKDFLEFYEEKPLSEQEELLGLALFEDILHQKKEFASLVFLFDTHEKFYERGSGYLPESDRWFRQFVGNFNGMESRVLFVVSGRECLLWEEVQKEWEEKIKGFSLEKLGLQDARRFLEEAGIPSKHHPLFIRTTQGLPLALYLACLHYFQLESQSRVDLPGLEKLDFRSLCERVFRHLWPDTRKMLEMLSFVTWFDREVAKEVSKQCHISWGIGDFPSLSRFAFVKELKPGVFHLDRAVAEMVQQRFKQDYPEEYRGVHSFFFSLFKERYEKSQKRDLESLKEAFRHAIQTGQENDEKWALENARDFLEKHFAPDFLIEVTTPLLADWNWRISFLPILGEAYFAKGDYERALVFLKEALSLQEEAFGPESLQAASTLNKLGSVSFAKGDYPSAVSLRERALSIQRKILPEESGEIARSLNNLGIAYRQLGDFKKAIECNEKALEIYQKALGPDHLDVSSSLNSLGNAYLNVGEFEKAIQYYQKGLEVRLKHLGKEHPFVAGSYNNLALAYHAKGDLVRAIENHRISLEIKLKVLPPNHPEVATSYINLGTAYEDKGELTLALEYYRKGLKIFLQAFGRVHPYVAGCYENIGGVLQAQGKLKSALENFSRSLKIRLQTIGEEHPDTALVYRRLGDLYLDLGDFEESVKNFQKALALQRKFFGESHPELGVTLRSLGLLNLKSGDLENAFSLANQALGIFRKFFPHSHPEVAFSLALLGEIERKRGNEEKALKLLGEAHSILKETLGENHPDTQRLFSLLERKAPSA
ncbi:MAG: tetratricopeptide repeat protein [Caldiserica bacterium]|nr:tetratricopeptide repeat protein [Caldisericota bacterium]MDH7562002.1 tetratricopeptide repeat protein [Caldisericota bacterium]